MQLMVILILLFAVPPDLLYQRCICRGDAGREAKLRRISLYPPCLPIGECEWKHDATKTSHRVEHGNCEWVGGTYFIRD